MDPLHDAPSSNLFGLRVLPLLSLLLLCSCVSLAEVGQPITIQSESSTVELRLMFSAPGPVLSSPRHVVLDFLVGVIAMYPLDVFCSFCCAMQAPFDPDFDIRWGPVGAVAGVTLPGVTLMPYILPPFISWSQDEVNLTPGDVDLLVARMTQGDDVAAYHQTVGVYPPGWDQNALVSVQVTNEREVGDR